MVKGLDFRQSGIDDILVDIGVYCAFSRQVVREHQECESPNQEPSRRITDWLRLSAILPDTVKLTASYKIYILGSSSFKRNEWIRYTLSIF